MSLSPKDDPRTWLVSGRPNPRPPLHARLLYYDLTTAEGALLRTMLEYAPEGSLLEASPQTYAETSGLSVRHVRNLIYGWKRKDGSRVPGLVERHILTVKRKGRKAPHPRPAAYVFNEWALRLRPEVLERLEAGIQQSLPGVRHKPKPALPSTTISDVHRQPLPHASAMVADDSKAANPKARERDSTTATSLTLADQEGGVDVDALVQSLLARRR